MYNKQYKKKIKSKSQKLKIVYIILLIILVIAFAGVWLNVFLTSSRFSRQLDEMVEGKDYYIEEVTITKKDYDSYYTGDSSVETTNYFFYYDDSLQKKMFVDEDAYKKYSVGDKVTAYTIDHINYGFTKESILPNKEYKKNEIKKCIGVVLGTSIVLFCILIWTSSKKA